MYSLNIVTKKSMVNIEINLAERPVLVQYVTGQFTNTSFSRSSWRLLSSPGRATLELLPRHNVNKNLVCVAQQHL
jgi:hypothetical protein